MKKVVILSLVLSLSVCMGQLRAQVRELPRAVPEAEGVPSGAVAALFDSLMALPRTEIHSVMVVRHGKVIGEIYPEPFAPEYRHTMYSCSKTFVGAAVGLAIEENRLRLDDRVGAFFPEMLPDSVSANLADMTVRDLLTMTSGITPDWNMRSQTAEWIRTYLAKPVVEPGSKFQYDSICTYLLSAIVQKATGETVLDYLKRHVFAPMNITEVDWEVSPEGYNTGGWGLHIQSESLAKFGLLLLNGGNWQGRQLLPASWVKQMMTEHHAGTGYGYQMWRGEYPGAWDLDGALGQYVLIIPDKDMVVVITECTLINGLNQRRLVWNRLLPEVADAPLPANARAYARLQKKQQAVSLPFAKGEANSTQAVRFAKESYILSGNSYGWQSVRLDFDKEAKTVSLDITGKDGKTEQLRFGHKCWLETVLAGCPPYSIRPVGSFEGIERPFRAAGSYGWTEPGVLRLKVHYVDWVSSLDLTLAFGAEGLTLDVKPNFTDAVETISGTPE